VTDSKSILAAVVLYRISAEASPAFSSLRSLIAAHPAQGAAIQPMLFDNSPQPQPVPAGFDGAYIANPANPGLAACYNLALQAARRQAIPWLMLLDHDTTLTPAYLAEVVAEVDRLANQQPDPDQIVALIPRLLDHGVPCSPIHPPAFGPATPIAPAVTGVCPHRLHAFNSGAVLRVSALEAIGGFSPDFPLDYLDHSTFAALQDRGGRLHILRATLQHDLSSNHEDRTPQNRTDPALIRRQASVLDAEYRFYRRFGSPADRLKRRLRLLRACAGRILRGKEHGQTWRMFKSALRP
jgi:GT2 family glycosyltransferase